MTPLLRREIAAVLLAILVAAPAASGDWLSYRGPTQNGVSTEKGLATEFPADGPKVLWKAKVGTGTSSITVSGGRAFTMGNTGGADRVVCFDAKSGREIWKREYPLDLDKRMFEGGTAGTPTLDGNRVYTISHQGDFFCLDAASGQPIWYQHFQKDFGGRRPQWGFAGSATIEGNLVIVDVGGKGASTVALDKTNGKVAWKSGDDEAGYATPVVATLGGRRTVVMFKAAHLVGLDAKDGRELWRTAWKTDYGVNAATPIIVGDRIFVSSGYGFGCALFEIGPRGAVEKWRNRNLKAHINSPVYAQGFLYGIDDQAGPGAPLVCVDFANGQAKWSERGIGGALVEVDGRLVILSELGELIIAEASPGGFRALSRAQVLSKRCWVQPTFSDGLIFCRNNTGSLVCLDASAK